MLENSVKGDVDLETLWNAPWSWEKTWKYIQSNAQELFEAICQNISKSTKLEIDATRELVNWIILDEKASDLHIPTPYFTPVRWLKYTLPLWLDILYTITAYTSEQFTYNTLIKIFAKQNSIAEQVVTDMIDDMIASWLLERRWEYIECTFWDKFTLHFN